MITRSAKGFVSETGAVDGLKGGERDTNNQHRILLQDAVQEPYHTVIQLVRMGSMVPLERVDKMGAGASQLVEEVETLLCFLGQ